MTLPEWLDPLYEEETPPGTDDADGLNDLYVLGLRHNPLVVK